LLLGKERQTVRAILVESVVKSDSGLFWIASTVFSSIIKRVRTRQKGHLEYDSIAAWFEGEGISTPIMQIKDEARRSKYLEQLGELRQHLFDRHLKTLAREEQDLFHQGTHPSQNHAFKEAAKPYVEALRKDLSEADDVLDVRLGFLQGNRIGLEVVLKQTPSFEERIRKPWLYHGFEVRYLGASQPHVPNDTGLARYRLTVGGPRKETRKDGADDGV
jgi:hypothetical protein